jgi:hypothetical protein
LPSPCSDRVCAVATTRGDGPGHVKAHRRRQAAARPRTTPFGAPPDGPAMVRSG